MAGGKASCKVTFGTETVEPKVSFDVGRDNDTLRLSTKLEFSEEFKLRMKLYDRQRHGTEKWLRRAINDAPDEMTREILEGIVRQIDTDEEWHDWLQWNWRGSQRAVRNRIDEIRKEYRSVLTALKEQCEAEAYGRNAVT